MTIKELKYIVKNSIGGPKYFFKRFAKEEELYRRFAKGKWCKVSNGCLYNLTDEAKRALNIDYSFTFGQTMSVKIPENAKVEIIGETWISDER